MARDHVVSPRPRSTRNPKPRVPSEVVGLRADDAFCTTANIVAALTQPTATALSSRLTAINYSDLADTSHCSMPWNRTSSTRLCMLRRMCSQSCPASGYQTRPSQTLRLESTGIWLHKMLLLSDTSNYYTNALPRSLHIPHVRIETSKIIQKLWTHSPQQLTLFALYYPFKALLKLGKFQN